MKRKRRHIQTTKINREEKANQIKAYMDMMRDLGQAVDENNKLNKLI